MGDYAKLKPYRMLDIDDMIIMSMMADDVPLQAISEFLLLTPPAISHRRLKYEHLFEDFYLPYLTNTTRKGYKKTVIKRYLSPRGREICTKFKAVLEELLKVQESDEPSTSLSNQ